MKLSSFSALALAAASSASPLVKRATDADILNYALTLEHLEDTFYREGLAKFSADHFKEAGFGDDFYNNIKIVSEDEATHVSFLTTALTAAGATPVAECEYNFPYEDVMGFVTLASVLEGVGVSAYLGAAASIMSKTYLTAAGSILTVEARHSSYIRAGLEQVPFPQSFDNPLTLNQVYTLAAQFIVSCPESNPALPVKAFPTLTAASPDGAIMTGSQVHLTVGEGFKDDGKSTVYAAFITVTGPIFVDAKWEDDYYVVEVPMGISGQSYIVINSDNAAVTDDSVLAGPAIVEISS